MTRAFLGQAAARAPSFLVTARTPLRVVPVHMQACRRKFVVGGYWQSRLSRAKLCRLRALSTREDVPVIIAPAAICVAYKRELLLQDLGFWAQCFLFTGQGRALPPGRAYTGEVMADMVKDVRCDWIAVGDSERSQFKVSCMSQRRLSV